MRPIFLCIVLFLVSCSKELDNSTSQPNEEKSSYWVNTTDSFWAIYALDTFTFTKSPADPSVTETHSENFIRETCLGEIQDFGTPYPTKVRQELFKSVGSAWEFYRDFKVINTATQFQRDFNNIKTLNLQAPVHTVTKWKGNTYIDTSIIPQEHSEWNFQYRDIGKPYTLQGFQFPSTIKVLQVADSNAIEKQYSLEIYAKDIGLIYSTYEILEKQTPTNPWTIPENGIIVRKKIVDWKGK